MSRSVVINSKSFLRSEVMPNTVDVTRPSISYWQDSLTKFRQNRRAVYSAIFIMFLIFFSSAGPVFWDLDPTHQDVYQISTPPWSNRAVTLIEEKSRSSDSIMETVESFKFLGQPNTESIFLRWPANNHANGFHLYRSIVPVQGGAAFGLPLASLPSSKRQFTDKLNLTERTYYYTLISSFTGDKRETIETITVTPQKVLFTQEAINRGLLKANEKPSYTDQYYLDIRPLGTDYLGRDMLARLMHGARVSLFIGLVAPLLYIAVGVIYGSLAGLIGGLTDQLMMRFSDFVVALPFLLFMILFKVIFGIGPGESGIVPMMIAMVILLWPATARLIRGQVLVIREESYVNASRLLGSSSIYLITRHMIPNTLGLIMVNITFAVPAAIFTEAFLSFIGMGVSPPTPSWGSMCNEGLKTMLTHPHELIFPALLISLTVLSFNLLGDGLRDAFDSKLRNLE